MKSDQKMAVVQNVQFFKQVKAKVDELLCCVLELYIYIYIYTPHIYIHICIYILSGSLCFSAMVLVRAKYGCDVRSVFPALISTVFRLWIHGV